MKKFTAVIAIILVVALVGAFAVGCKEKTGEIESRPYYTEGFGNTSGLTPTKTIDANMSAVDMLTAGVDNYYGADYVASVSEGKITTEVIGISLTQFVQSMTIRQGSANGDYRQFSDNQSGSIKDDSSLPIEILIWEETGYSKSGTTEDIKFHSGLKKEMGASTIDRNGESAYAIFFEEGKTFQPTETFSNINDYADAKAANPTKIWMYEINKDTVIADKCTAPTPVDGGYNFKIVADPNTSTTEYQKQMMYMLKEQSGINPDKFQFDAIELDITMSDNGFITKVDLVETYTMTLKIFFNINITISLKSTRYISYKDTETGMTPADLDKYMARF